MKVEFLRATGCDVVAFGKNDKSGPAFVRPWVGRRTPNTWLLQPCLLLVLLLPQGPTAAQVKEVRRVLVFYELGLSSPAVSLLDHRLSIALENSPYQIELYREYLETTLFPGPEEQQEIRDSFIRKYRERRPDLIIAFGPSSLRFMTDIHEKSFPGVPIVFGGTSPEEVDNPKLDSHFTGVWQSWKPEKTLELALRLKPDTKNVFVVGGTSSFDRHLEVIFKEHLREYEKKLNLFYLVDLDMPGLLDRVGHLPNQSIILYTHLGQDGKGTKYIGASQSGPMVVAAANAPVFSPSDVDLGYGAVGGDLESFEKEGNIVGGVALRVLGGEKPQEIPMEKGANVYMIDWRAMKRWGLNEGNLPPGSVVLNREPSLWQQNRRYMIPGVIILLAQTFAILALLWQRSQRRKTEAELKRSENKFSKSFRQSPLAVIITRLRDSYLLDVSESFEQLTGWQREEVIHKMAPEFDLWMNAERRAEFVNKVQAQGRVSNLEVLIRRKDGQTRTMLLSAELIEMDGERCALSVVADITERKLVEDALSNVGRKLIEAHEEERRWVARELHDDLNQRLALLAVNLDVLNRELPPSASNAIVHTAEIKHQIRELGMDVQALSHRLHSSKLEYLGLSAAAGAFCREFSDRKQIPVDFRCENIPRSLPEEVSLCLFRVLQEALQNAAKHSGSQKLQVSITLEADHLRLTVSDFGSGFNMEDALKTPGLGITSMRERLKIVDGELRIDSRSGCGTVVSARVPYHEKSVVARAASSGA